MNEQIKKRSRGRSPSYPGINLESAIERAKTIWKAEAEFSPSRCRLRALGL